MRDAIAHLMARSKREIPHYYLTVTIDLGRALDWMHERNRKIPVADRLVPAVLLLKATALAAHAVTDRNGHWINDHLVPAARCTSASPRWRSHRTHHPGCRRTPADRSHARTPRPDLPHPIKPAALDRHHRRDDHRDQPRRLGAMPVV